MPSLEHVLWIGGPPGSGKTTIAKLLARRHGLRRYEADAHTWAHRDRAIRDGDPAAVRWEAMTPEERWVTTTPAEMLELWLDVKRGPMVVDDLRKLPESPLTVAEGTPIRPRLVAEGLLDPARAVWLSTTPELRRLRLESRGTPGTARDNWVQLANLVAVEIEREATAHGVTVVHVDGSQTVEETTAAVEALFSDALAAGPRAESLAARRALLRYENTVTVDRYVSYFARPWTTGDLETTVVPFSCECGAPDCGDVVEVAVAGFARSAGAGAPPVLAVGHA